MVADGAVVCSTDPVKLVADDGAADNHFGHSVATASGGLIVVTAAHDDGKARNSGAAYLFRAGANGSSPRLVTKLVADDGALDDYFGVSVAAGSGIVVVGVHRDDDKGHNSGSAYVYCIGDSGKPVQLSVKLVA